jgi:hypothetical protein
MSSIHPLSKMLRLRTCTSCLRSAAQPRLRFSSSEATPMPPMLAKLKQDMKTAMRAKDTVR